MGGKKGGINEKQAAGRAKKAENEAKKATQVAAQQEAVQAEEWKKGSNTLKAARDESAAAKADEAARKRQEKAALLAAEEQEMAGASGKLKTGTGVQSKRSKQKKKDDLSLLEDSLQKAADKKVKKSKQDIFRKQQENKSKPHSSNTNESQNTLDPLLANTQQMIGGDSETVGRQANVARMQDQGASGIDAALGSLNISSPGVKKSAKALYNEFEARMLPTVKDDYPGLRLTQYKEKVWALWKKSPENPANQLDAET